MTYHSQPSLFDESNYADEVPGLKLMVCDAQGHYRPASTDQILQAAHSVIDEKMVRGAELESPKRVKEFLITKLASLEHEVFGILFLDSKFRLIDYAELFRGTLTAAPVYPREVIKEALRRNAAALILAHNHPSGLADPSNQDIRLTKQLKEALHYVDVRIVDHIVVGGLRAVSFSEKGLL